MYRCVGRILSLATVCVLAVTLLNGCRFGTKPNVTPEVVAQAIEKLAGPSDMPADTKVEWMPYTIPVSSDIKAVTIGNAQIYMNSAPDTAIVVRPMRRGVQTLMYVTGTKAPKAFKFEFKLPAETELVAYSDGDVRVHDLRVKRTYPLLSSPWAKSVEGHKSYKTTFSVKGHWVTQTTDLSEAKFPVVIDPPYDDPLTQIIEGRLPVLKEAQNASRDGPKHDLFGLGKVYGGPNGLEFRLNNRGSLLALKDVTVFTGSIAAYGPGLRQAVTEGSSNRLVATLLAAGASTALVAEVMHNHLEDLLEEEVFKNFCLGMTIAKEGPLKIYIRLTAFGEPITEIGIPEIRVWAEPCEKDKPLFLQGRAPKTTSASGNDMEIEERAETLPPLRETPQMPPHSDPPSRPAVGDYNVDMNAACQQEFTSSSRALARDLGDKNSWVCVDGADNELGGVDLNRYCGNTIHGSYAISINETAYGWRCRVS